LDQVNDDMEDQIVEQEIVIVMTDLINAIQDAKSNLQILGNTSTTNIIVSNLDTIEDLFYEEDGKLYKQTLNLKTKWETPAPF